LDYDAIVIGAGPAGWAAALQGSKIGLNVAIVERNVLPGGASILGPTKIRVANPNGEHILTTDQIFVATGSRPHDPTPSHSMIARLR
jgi:pyruvate/2-oxoglutarate dehydrogenase complex dihydrolipoamide dehydrogenase (E3) component